MGREVRLISIGKSLLSICWCKITGKPTDDDYTWNNTQHRAYHFFSSERAKTYKISPYQGLREYLTHSDFNTRKLLEKPLKVVDLENWGWRNQEIEQLSSFRERSLIEYRGLVKNRKTLMLTPNAWLVVAYWALVLVLLVMTSANLWKWVCWR